MLNSGEIQTFLELIRGLNESLRTLATKVELMERSSATNASSFNELQKEMALVAQRTEQFRDFMNEIGDFTSLHASEIEGLNSKLIALNTGMAALNETSKHLDAHLDSNEVVTTDTNARICRACDSVEHIAAPVMEIRETVKPLAEIVAKIRRPVFVVIVIYVLVTSMIGIVQTVGTIGEWWGRKSAPAQQASKVSDARLAK
jgi:methyl-accepting chemotaxis protein